MAERAQEHTLDVIDRAPDGIPSLFYPSGSGHSTYHDVYLCGKCGIIVARDLPPDVLQRSLIFCPNCGTQNRAPAKTERTDDVIQGKRGSLTRLET